MRERIASVRAIVFDVTGTLIEARGGVERLYVATAAAHGLRLEPSRIRRAFGAALTSAPPLAFPGEPPGRRGALERDWWREVVRLTVAGCAAQPQEPRAFDSFFDDLHARFARPDAWSVLPEAPHVLAELSRRRYLLGVLSNFDGRLPGLLAGLGLAEHLATVATSSALGFAKPDGRAFAAVLSRLGVPADAGAYVGDSPDTDAGGASAAGLLPVLIGAPLPPDVDGLEAARLADLLDLFPGSDR